MVSARCPVRRARRPQFKGSTAVSRLRARSVGAIVSAVSSRKRNGFTVEGFVVEGLGHEQFERALPAEGFSWPDIEIEGDAVEILLGEDGQVGALRQVLAEQAVGVFVDAALPGAMGIGEVHLNAGLVGEPGMICHFPTLVVGHRESLLGVDAVEHVTEPRDGGVGRPVGKLGERDEQSRSLHKRADR